MTPEAPIQVAQQASSADIGVELQLNGVAVIEIRRPPNNFFDVALITTIADALDELEGEGKARAVVLASEGKHFCAGADFTGSSGAGEVDADRGARELYSAALRLFGGRLPIVAAVQGAAIGGGLGLALAADFRVGAASSRLCANFVLLGFHHGFGLTETLPRVVGRQFASDMLITGRRIDGVEAHRQGLLDRLVDDSEIRTEAMKFATEIAAAAPLAVRSVRQTLRRELVEAVARATEHERTEQAWLRETADFAEGVRASAERRTPIFTAR